MAAREFVNEPAGPAWVKFGENVIQQEKRGFAEVRAGREVDGEAKGQGQGALLALAGLGFDVPAVEEKFDVVAVRPNRCQSAPQILALALL